MLCYTQTKSSSFNLYVVQAATNNYRVKHKLDKPKTNMKKFFILKQAGTILDGSITCWAAWGMWIPQSGQHSLCQWHWWVCPGQLWPMSSQDHTPRPQRTVAWSQQMSWKCLGKFFYNKHFFTPSLLGNVLFLLGSKIQGKKKCWRLIPLNLRDS